MQFGLQINPYLDGATGNAWDGVLTAARVLDQSAFDSLWVYDHLLYEGGYSGHPYPEPVMEAFTTLGAIAAVTSRVRLGQLVLGMPYRNPALMTKMATTLDLISHGRTILGIGAGWHKREYEGYGFGEWEEVPVRMRRLEEGIKVILALWTERPASFEGKFYRLDNVQEKPDPVQKPHPPIMIGGSGEKVTLRLVAQYAQLCNVGGDPATAGRRFEILREHCERLGRRYDAITKSIYQTVLIGRDDADVKAKQERFGDYIPRSGALIGTPEQLIDQFAAYARVGCQYAIYRTPDWQDSDAIRLFAERVIPALAAEGTPAGTARS
jgi:F420-dependent oxidoreductase-like protein